MHNETAKTDQELVAATLADKHAFAEIVHRYEAPIRRYVARVGCADNSDIEDVIQETFVKVFINLNDYDLGLKFSSWLYRIAHNETISFLRKKKVRPGVLPMSADDAAEFFAQLADENDPQKQTEERDDARVIRELLDHLGVRYKEVLILRFLEEKSYTEISNILKIPEGTVATLINRAKKELKRALATRGFTKT